MSVLCIQAFLYGSLWSNTPYFTFQWSTRTLALIIKNRFLHFIFQLSACWYVSHKPPEVPYVDSQRKWFIENPVKAVKWTGKNSCYMYNSLHSYNWHCPTSIICVATRTRLIWYIGFACNLESKWLFAFCVSTPWCTQRRLKPPAVDQDIHILYSVVESLWKLTLA